MLVQLPSSEPLSSDFIPQAEIVYPVEEIGQRFRLVYDCDDLHDFVGAAFLMNKDLIFTIKHYQGTPDDVFTIYFRRESDLGLVSRYVHEILESMNIPVSALTWDRAQGPEGRSLHKP